MVLVKWLKMYVIHWLFWWYVGQIHIGVWYSCILSCFHLQGHTQVNFVSALLQVTMSDQLDLPVRQAGEFQRMGIYYDGVGFWALLQMEIYKSIYNCSSNELSTLSQRWPLPWLPQLPHWWHQSYCEDWPISHELLHLFIKIHTW